ncbi:MAG: TolC family protein [bacterium]
MKVRILFLLFLGFLCFPSFSRAAAEKTGKIGLQECYELAIKRSETVAISDEEIKRVKARYIQALGSALPVIAFNGQEFLQDDSSQGNSGTAAGSVANTLTRFSTPQVALTLNQTLFDGFKVINALKLTHADRRLQHYKKEDVERLLFRDVATAFYAIAKIEQDIRTSQKIIGVLKGQIGELKDRVKLGKSRVSEQIAQEADLSLLEADLVKKQGDRRVAYEMLSFLTGLDPQPPIDVRDPVDRKIKPVEDYLAQAESRPDILASKESFEIAKGNVKIKKGDLLPNATATANIYPYRVGFRSDILWDATFNLNVPVFNLTTWGNIKDAKLQAKQAEIQSQLTRRQAMSEVKQAYEAYQSSHLQYRKYQYASQKAEESYQKQVEDFRLNLITNLDVLQSERTWLDALRSRDTAKAQLWSDWASLVITIGALP